MLSGETGVISAIVAVATLLITKIVDFAVTRLKMQSDFSFRKNQFNIVEYDEMKQDFKKEIARLREEIEALRDDNITLQVEKAKLELMVEHLKKEIDRLNGDK